MSAAYQLQFTTDFQHMECGECGISFYIPSSRYRQLKDKGESWYCPNGHGRVFRESEVAKLEKKLAEERQRHLDTLSRLNDSEREKARLAVRVKNGVCPCCKRTFKQLAAHMKHKHPGFKP